MKVAFVHPDLGIGGAQQLVVNLCVAAKNNNYAPHIFTPYHHQSFPQTHDGTITVHQHGSFYGLIPDAIKGRFKGILAYIRTLLCALWLVIFDNKYDVVVADQVSIVLPLLRIFRNKTIFYCHFPDKLLAGNRKNPLKKIYRFFIDLTQQICLIFAHKIYVNSQYTKSVFYESFKILKLLKIKVQVLYPAIDFSKFDREEVNQKDQQVKDILNDLKECKYFFSLNRYQRKKNINLALLAFKHLIHTHPECQNKVKLVIAGGYDLKVKQNVQHLIQLKNLAKQLQIQSKTYFYCSITDKQRSYLLKNAQCVLYTPKNQHFGIVPVQSMYCNIPILAHNSGGPKQSVGKNCGFLLQQHDYQWGQKMWEIYSQGKKKWNKGKQHVVKNFGFEAFSKKFMIGVKNFGSPLKLQKNQ